MLDEFRIGLHECFQRRADVLSELVDAITCAPGPVTDLARLSLDPVHRRGHGALYDALACGLVDAGRLRAVIASCPVPRIASPDGRERIVLGVDVSNWLRPDAGTSADRAFCHTYARGRGQAQMIPGWPYSFVAALEAGASSWTALLDAVRLRPADDVTIVTAAQLRAVVGELTGAGEHRPADPDILVVLDAGYDTARLAWLLRDLPVTLVGRVRSDRVFHAPAGARRGPSKGRPPRHGVKLALRDPGSGPAPDLATVNDTDRYGRAEAVAFGRMHPRLAARGGWAGHDGPLPVIEGTVIGLQVERLPGDRDPRPVWLWASKPVPDGAAELDHWWSMYLRRFDLEHTFRFLKQTLGWTRPRLRDPNSADRWTWLILAAHTMLRLARPLAADHRLPWQRPLAPGELTPARVRADYRRVHATTTHPAGAPKPSRAGPGRPKGSRNRVKAPIQPIGKHASPG
ncbi:NF041680 family putative transposase [Microbacterium sp.]|uniref:NF041680 family putative transposase n=1 Tax=Microbacterium sp. TaxID=51671 RepID=UPI003C72E05B